MKCGEVDVRAGLLFGARALDVRVTSGRRSASSSASAGDIYRG